MEENGDTEDREETKDEVKGERQKCTRDIFVLHVQRQGESHGVQNGAITENGFWGGSLPLCFAL